MEQSVRAQRTVFVVGTILFGVVGAALWDGLKPVLGWIGMGLLAVVTLGMSSLQDGIYVDISRGTQDRAALAAFAAIVGATLGVLTVIMLRRSDRWVAATSPAPRWLDSRATAMALMIVMILLFARTNYVIKAAAHLDRVQTIAAPHLDESQRLLYRSRAAQMEGMADYVALLTELKGVAEAHQSLVPDFAVF
ncbi:MAG: hypothetical protein M3Q42_07110 [Pseudomonadota bacterium]|nr:hypothetical protein [Pseudomonadota bacterium]